MNKQKKIDQKMAARALALAAIFIGLKKGFKTPHFSAVNSFC
jgi:hypothetical protein